MNNLKTDIIALFGSLNHFAVATKPKKSRQLVHQTLATHEETKTGMYLSTRMWWAKKMGLSVSQFNSRYGYPRRLSSYTAEYHKLWREKRKSLTNKPD